MTFVCTDCRNEDHKYEVLVELYNILTIGQSIIFVKARRRDPHGVGLLANEKHSDEILPIVSLNA